ncbi:hypothetical protein EDC96DRAFT_506299 [Choanephora cucurbitarum]|nr:hypothetical protein EDC96DRAFT_506299 [Choanephora cucurbitarum]
MGSCFDQVKQFSWIFCILFATMIDQMNSFGLITFGALSQSRPIHISFFFLVFIKTRFIIKLEINFMKYSSIKLLCFNEGTGSQVQSW